MGTKTPGTVLLIHNDRERRRLVHAELEPRGHTVIDGALAAPGRITMTSRPDLVLVDSQVAGALPTNFLDDIDGGVVISDVPVLIANTSRLSDLVIDVEVQLQLSRSGVWNANSASTIDVVTDLFCSAHMRAEVARFGAIARRYEQPLSIVLMGLDRFERTNRLWGTDVGDEVLRDVATRLASDVRDSDVVGRWHADQFMVILPCTPSAGARFLAERFRQTLAESQHVLTNGNAVSITASFGCAGAEHGDVIDAAETALKSAKRSGRNAVSVDS